ncbi:MAG: NAD(+)/NADH kinase [Crenarchaeota archaeon]|nr:NAD(+)/NADH kinase [Thermoproteota archaeon]
MPRTPIVIYARPDRVDAVRKAIEVYRALRGHGITPLLDASLAPSLGGGYSYTDLRFEKPGTLIVIGGDGTLLHVARLIGCSDTIVFPIHAGRRGYYYEHGEATERIAEAIATGNYRVEELVRLKVTVVSPSGSRHNTPPALNEAALIALGSKTITVSLYVDNTPVYSSVEGDGVIVATPYGSRGYNASVGGPLLLTRRCPACQPAAVATIVNPLGRYPPVVVGQRCITIILESTQSPPRLVVDGVYVERLVKGCRLRVHPGGCRLKVARLQEAETLHTPHCAW